MDPLSGAARIPSVSARDRSPVKRTIDFRHSGNPLVVLGLLQICRGTQTREILPRDPTMFGIGQDRHPPKRNDKSRKSARNVTNSLEIAAPPKNSLDGRAQSGRGGFSISQGKFNFFFETQRILDVLNDTPAYITAAKLAVGVACEEGDSFCSQFP